MGAANAKDVCRLSEKSDLREMHRCIESIKGQASNSASATDTWVCELKDGTTFLGEICTHTFMKIGFKNKKTKSRGLDYELNVYLFIIAPLLARDISPNFLRPQLASRQVSFDDLKNALDVGLKRKPAAQRYANLERNLKFMNEEKDDRPAIDDDVPFPGRGVTIVDRALYNHSEFIAIATEYTKVTTYRDWLSKHHSSNSRLLVLLQIFITLHTMQLCKLMHNDLHARNIFIKELARPINLVYVIDAGSPISIKTRYLVMIYDFDRATCPEVLGPNPFAPTNRFQAKRDLMCLYRNFLAVTDIEFEAGVIRTMFNIKVMFPPGYFKRKGSHHWSACNGDDVKRSLRGGIRRLVGALESVAEQPIDSDARIYVAVESMFHESGALKSIEEQEAVTRDILFPLQKVKPQFKTLVGVGSPHRAGSSSRSPTDAGRTRTSDLSRKFSSQSSRKSSGQSPHQSLWRSSRQSSRQSSGDPHPSINTSDYTPPVAEKPGDVEVERRSNDTAGSSQPRSRLQWMKNTPDVPFGVLEDDTMSRSRRPQSQPFPPQETNWSFGLGDRFLEEEMKHPLLAWSEQPVLESLGQFSLNDWNGSKKSPHPEPQQGGWANYQPPSAQAIEAMRAKRRAENSAQQSPEPSFKQSQKIANSPSALKRQRTGPPDVSRYASNSRAVPIFSTFS